ncbi:hypothetical protein CRUP_003731, partial [Coryphaenoides rupestris]
MTWFGFAEQQQQQQQSNRMADQSRQTKLAAAKKKLKEFQQKSSPVSGGGGGGGGGETGGGGAGAKKKRKVKGGNQADAPSSDRNSPDNAYAEAETRVSPVPHLPDHPKGEPGHGAPVSNPSSAVTTNSESVRHNTEPQSYPDTNGNGVEKRPLSSTESLRQLSQQLNGLLSESSTTYVNGDSSPSPVNEKELESRNQELTAALDSSHLTNSQLNTQLDQL